MVSVIIPCYNLAKYLPEAIESVLSQTYKPIEIIVVDDGSSDDTSDVAKRYQRHGVKLIGQPNKGLAAARNAGIREAVGEYISILDADDSFLPEKIERQVEYMKKNSECGVCYCGIYHYWENNPGEMMHLKYQYYSDKEAKRALLKKNFINPLSVLIRKSVGDSLGWFNESYRNTEDWEFWVRLAFSGANFGYLPVPLARYRMRLDSMVRQKSGLSSEKMRKGLQYKIFLDLYKRSPVDVRQKYSLLLVVFYHYFKYTVARLEKYLPFLDNLRIWLQKKRLSSV